MGMVGKMSVEVLKMAQAEAAKADLPRTAGVTEEQLLTRAFKRLEEYQKL